MGVDMCYTVTDVTSGTETHNFILFEHVLYCFLQQKR